MFRFYKLFIILIVFSTGCVPVVMSPIPAANPLDDRLWVEIYNHSDLDLITVDSRGAIVRGKNRQTKETVYGLRKGETFEFPLTSFNGSGDSYTLRIIGWRCEGDVDVSLATFERCQQTAYRLERVRVPYSNRSGYRKVIEVRYMR